MAARRVFDLSRASHSARRRVLDALRADAQNVRGCSLDPGSWALTVELHEGRDGQHLDALIEGLRRSYRLVEGKIVGGHRARALDLRPIGAALASSPDLLLFDDGLVGLQGALLGLFRFFERTFAALAQGFGAGDLHLPPLVPVELLAELGYFGHFPQQVTFCSHLSGDLPSLQALVSEAAHRPMPPTAQLQASLAAPRHCLTPAVCLPCYRLLRGASLAPGRPRVMTVQNPVFRFEGTDFQPLRRGWSFTVRDIVCFGQAAALERFRREAVERALDVCRELDLDVSVAVASDPFFFDGNRDKAVYQRMGEVKFELLFPMPEAQEPLAASSFNLHREFYTSRFDVRMDDGSPAESACVGFGIERWMFGFLSQKGLDPAAWPAQVRDRG